MSRVLITGSSGFVGRALCERIAAEGGEFVRAIRQGVGTDSSVAVVGNVNADTNWSSALDKVDVVVHLASRVHVMHEESTESLAAYRSVNTDGTLNLARQAAQLGIRRFLFISTAKVHGEGRGTPYSVDDPANPVDAYSVSKWEAECGLIKLSSEFGMEVVVLRPPLVYGPGVAANFLRMMEMLKSGFPLPFSRVENLRSLVFVGNLVDLIVLCLEHPQAAGRTFFVSDGEDISTPDLLLRLGHALNSPAKLFPAPVSLLNAGLGLIRQQATAQRLLGSFCVDIARTRELLKWSPPVGLNAGLRLTAESFLRSQSGR